MLTVGSLIEGIAESIDNRGYGVVRINSFVIFVKELMTNEKALIKIIETKKSYAIGIIEKLLIKSPNRREHEENDLGSTDLIFMDEKAQLDWQKKITEDSLLKIANLTPVISEPISDLNYFNYRNKTVFHVIDDKILKFGLYKKDIHELKELNYFSLASNKANEILWVLSNTTIKIEENVLKHLVIRTNEKNEALVTLVSKKETFSGLEEIISTLKTINNIVGITININPNKNIILSANSKTLYKENKISLKLGSYNFEIDDRSFFQINLPVINKAFQIIKEHLNPLDEVLDLYSGVGVIGFKLAEKVKKITLVETSVNNIFWANEFKKKHSLNHVEVIRGKAEDEIKNLKGNVIVVDPPRSGIHERLLTEILNKKFEKMFYLSCDLRSLSRDLNKLKTKYYIEGIYPIKMFFQTTSTETLVILKRN